MSRVSFREAPVPGLEGDTRLTFHVETDASVAAGRILAFTQLFDDVHYVTRSNTSIELFPSAWAYSSLCYSKDVFLRVPVIVEFPWNAATSVRSAGCFLNECVGLDLERDLFQASSTLDGRGPRVPFEGLARALASYEGIESDVPRSAFLGLVNGTYGNFRELDSSWRYNYRVPVNEVDFQNALPTNPLYGWTRNVFAGEDLATLTSTEGSWPLAFLVPISVILKQAGYNSCPLILPRSLTITLNANAMRVYAPGTKVVARRRDFINATKNNVVSQGIYVAHASDSASLRVTPGSGMTAQDLDVMSLLSQGYVDMRDWRPRDSDADAPTADYPTRGVPSSDDRSKWIKLVQAVRAGTSSITIRFPSVSAGDGAIVARESLGLVEIGITGLMWRDRSLALRETLMAVPPWRSPLVFAVKECGKVFVDSLVTGATLSTCGLPRLDKLSIMIMRRDDYDIMREGTSRVTWPSGTLDYTGIPLLTANSSDWKARAAPYSFTAINDAPASRAFPELLSVSLLLPSAPGSVTDEFDTMTVLQGVPRQAASASPPVASKRIPVMIQTDVVKPPIEALVIGESGGAVLKDVPYARVFGPRDKTDLNAYNGNVLALIKRFMEDGSALRGEGGVMSRSRVPYWIADRLLSSRSSLAPMQPPVITIDTRVMMLDGVDGSVDLIQSLDMNVDVRFKKGFTCMDKDNMIWVLVSYGRLPCSVGQEAMAFYPRDSVESVPLHCLFA